MSAAPAGGRAPREVVQPQQEQQLMGSTENGQKQEPVLPASEFAALERLARGATTLNGGRWTTRPVEPTDKWAWAEWWNVWVECEDGGTTGLPGVVTAPPEVATFIAACSPTNILTLLSALRTAQEDSARLAKALEPFAEFSRQWERQPLRGMHDEFYMIHTGTEFEATLRRSDLQRAADALGECSHG